MKIRASFFGMMLTAAVAGCGTQVDQSAPVVTATQDVPFAGAGSPAPATQDTSDLIQVSLKLPGMT